MDTKYKPKLLIDDPADRDAFGSHERVAGAIAELVLSDLDGRSIALTGSWGSGKSTVVKLLCSKLNNDTRVFQFDAWSHQGDPLRRTFLEQLVAFLEKANWSNRDDWKDDIERLSKRKWDETTTTRPHLTLAGFIYGLALAAMPISLILFDKAADTSVLKWVGFAFSILPFLLVLGALLAFCYAKKTKNEERRKKVLNSITPFSNKAEVVVENKRVETPDATSVEFQETFSRIMNHAVTKSRKMVVVIDNLDRISVCEAREIWATMRTFFDADGSANGTWKKSLWLVVPFDPEGAKNIWSDSHLPSGEASDSFIDKTFQTTFVVPRPVLSDWADYFKKMLETALRGIDEDEIHSVYWVFRQKLHPSLGIPTPRDIKLFINRLVSLYVQRGDEIPLRLQALYVAMSYLKFLEVGDVISKEPPAPHPFSVEFLGPEWRAELLALHYGVSPDRVLQIILEPIIEESILQKGPGKLNNVVNMPGFTVACEEYFARVSRYWAGKDSHLGAIAAAVFSELDVPVDHHWRAMWARIREGVMTIKSWGRFDPQMGSGLAGLARRFPNDQMFMRHVLESLSSEALMYTRGEPELKLSTVEETIIGMLQVINAISALCGEDFVRAHFRIPGRADLYDFVMTTCTFQDVCVEFTKFANPTEAPSQIIARLSISAAEDNLDSDSVAKIKAYMEQPIAWPWEEFIESCKRRLMTDGALKRTNLVSILDTLLHLSAREGMAADALRQLASEGHILTHYALLDNETSEQDRGLILYLLMRFMPASGPAKQHPKIASGLSLYHQDLKGREEISEVRRAVTELVRNYGGIGELLRIADSNSPASSFCQEVISQASSEKDITDLITPRSFIQNENAMYSSLSDEEYKSLVAKYVLETTLIDDLIKNESGDTSLFDVNLASLYGSALAATNGGNTKFNEFILSGLVTVPSSRWEQEADADYLNLFDLIVIANGLALPLSLEDEFQTQLQHWLDAFIDNDVLPKTVRENWETLVHALEENRQLTFLRNQRDLLIRETDSSKRTRRMSRFRSKLLGKKLLTEQADSIIRGAQDILNSNSVEQLKWLQEVAIECPSILKSSERETRNTFRATLAEKIEAGAESSECMIIIREIATALKIRPEKLKPEGNSSSMEKP